MSKKDEFTLKKVTVNFVLHEDKRGNYYEVFADEIKSALYYPYCNAEKATIVFAGWLKNTLKAMPKNDCTTIQFVCTWN